MTGGITEERGTDPENRLQGGPGRWPQDNGSRRVEVFTPPPIKCGNLDIRLKALEGRGGFEDLHVALFDKSRQVGGVRGTYVLRSVTSSFQDACQAAGTGAGACTTALFDAQGKPKPSLKALIRRGACDGAFLFLEEVQLEEHLRCSSIGHDFGSLVLSCLSGPMKRVTLVMCKAGAQEHPWAKLGFKRVEVDGTAWLLMELGFRRKRRPTAAKLRGRAFIRARLRATADASAKAATAGRGADGAPQLGRSRTPPSPLPPRAPLSATSAPTRPEPEPVPKRPRHGLLGGKLTPRVHYALVFATGLGADLLRLDANSFTNGTPGGHYWGCEWFPASLQCDVFKAFVKGMAEVVDVVGAMLKVEQLPTVPAVMKVLSPWAYSPGACLGLRVNKHMVSHFFSKGGRVEHIIQAVVDEAASFYSDRECTEDEDLPEHGEFVDYHFLPNHMLDGDFEFVKSALIPELAQC
mmetsp:Transcript_10837/g.24511  ORF Transcript_10837/g.24511 Transcript_10837/m.24511 type:complete len:465 (+) Transcript_10837:43-1437(+)|eukprot:CAMPEP_0197918700 /NCGR_PEP_ID=MMETSP1439-20131203/85934_1 /TAXON_ID=66791 /ORGANISM="Gonyaulax spinifera, Strain CCMP409" /LENGTH=464 /DNA_ID=CAMNT_0043540827 /DNA_START=43 /DNA_END=1437 /DNA_ORIENTATION=+